MMKINVILKKEDIAPQKISMNHIVVVLDILLATSTIVSLLHGGAKEVYPVVDKMEALSLSEGMSEKSPILIGEENGQLIDGFLPPNPLSLQEEVEGKSIILLTTNGTVAVRKVSHAKDVFIASLLNGAAVAERILRHYDLDQTINIVCSGSSNQFCMEDFYGAGSLVNELLMLSNKNDIELTDSARSAYLFYKNYASEKEGEQILENSSVGRMLIRQGFEDDIGYVNKRNVYSIVPKLSAENIIEL